MEEEPEHEEQVPSEEEISEEVEESPHEEEPYAQEEAPYEEEAEAQEEPLVSPDALPVTLKVELGRVEMAADKLLALSPGNLLELASRPDSPVYLTLNGQRVGKGELVMMGETLGIRILELGR